MFALKFQGVGTLNMNIRGGKSDISGSKITEIIAMIYFRHKNSKTDISGFCRGNPGFKWHCFWILMFIYRCQSIKVGGVFG